MTAPHYPHQNGVVKRNIWSIVGVIRAMLHGQGMSLHLWVEACNKAIYLYNQIPHHILGMITLEEDFSRRKPNVSHFRIFGTFVYYHGSKDSRKKVEPTTELGVFVGYIKTINNYQVYLPSIIMKFV